MLFSEYSIAEDLFEKSALKVKLLSIKKKYLQLGIAKKYVLNYFRT